MTAPETVWHFNRALLRSPAHSIAQGLRAQDRGDPDMAGVLAEHTAYRAALEAAGLRCEVLPATEAHPDSVFVEDPALVFSRGAIVLRPGAPSREPEAAALAPELRARFATVLDIGPEGYADGGDVLVLPGRVLIGLSARTDRAGAAGLVRALDRLGLRGEVVKTPPGVLHFKSDCALVGPDTVLTTARLDASGVFAGLRRLVVPEGEEPAANALRVNDRLLMAEGYPRTAEVLAQAGPAPVMLPTAQIARVDAGLSCMSLRWFDPAA